MLKALPPLAITIASPFLAFFVPPLLTFFVPNSIHLARILSIVLVIVIDAMVIDILLKRTVISAAVLSFLAIVFRLFR